MDINVGDKVYDLSDKKIVTVTSVSDRPHLLAVEYSDGESSSRAWAEENLCPVQVGDRLSFKGLEIATVTDVVMYSGEPGVRYQYPGIPTFYVTSMEEAAKHLVKEPENPVTSEHPYGDPFPIGSIVQFKRTRYRVDGFDGEHHDLTPEDGNTEGRLYFSPDFFELVQPPFPETQSVWEDSDGYRYFVKRVDKDENVVWLLRFSGQENGWTVQQLHQFFTKLM